MIRFDRFFRAKANGRTILANLIVFALLTFLFVIANHFKPTLLRLAASGPDGHTVKPQLIEAYGKLPLAFEANQGQADAQVKFLTRGSGYQLNLTATEAVLQLRNGKTDGARRKAISAIRNRSTARSQRSPKSAIVKLKLVDANPAPQVAGRAELPGKSHYYIGNDPQDWRTNVANYAQVEYEQVWSGINLVYYGNQRQLEYDFIVAPGADPNAIKLSFDGADEVKIDALGNLVVHVSGGEVVMQKPFVYQEVNGTRQPIAGSYQIRNPQSVILNQTVGFHLGEYDASLPLVIDPVLSYSTYLGGSGTEHAEGIAVDPAGNVYVTGWTDSPNFPTANPFQGTLKGGQDVYVTKLNSSGSTLVYSTYLGGSSSADFGFGIGVDALGNAYITGRTDSPDFPTTSPFQANRKGSSDGFVTKLNASGSALIYSTYLGGSEFDRGLSIAVDAAGSAYVTGYTEAFQTSDFPTANPFQAALNGTKDAFVTKLNPAGSALVYSTYLGGSSAEEGRGIAVDSQGNAYVTGLTFSDNLPTANPLIANAIGNGDAFVTKFNPAGSALVFSTYLGGSNRDDAYGIAADAAGNTYVIGSAGGANFPLVNPLQSDPGTFGTAFVTKINPTGSAFVYSTYLRDNAGGSTGRAIAADGGGNAYVTGSGRLPLVNPLPGSGNFGAFVAKLNPAGSTLVYSTHLGNAPNNDEGRAITVDQSGNVYVTGNTLSNNFPTLNPVQPNNGGGQDAFVTKIGGDTAPLPKVCVWQEFPIYRGSIDFNANKESNIVTIDNKKAEIISATKDSLIVRVPPELVGNRNNVLTLPDTTLREVAVVARVVRAPGDTVMASESRVRFCPPYLLLYDEVTRPAPPLVQQVMPGRGPRNRQAFLFLGNQNDGTAAVRVLNTSTGFPQPSTLLVKVIAPSGELFDKSSTPTIGNLLNIGQNNAGIQFPVTQTGIYIIIVEADRTSSFGPFPTLFQIHLAGNAGLPRRLINGNPEPPRAIRLTTLFNHPAPQPEILTNAAPGFGRFAETALFKFANPVSTSQFPIAVLIPPAIDPAGFPFGIPPVRAAAPLVLGRLANGVIDITVPSATTPGAATPVPGTVVDFTQVPIPASVLAPGPPPGVAAILGAADGNGVTLPITIPAGGVITSLIVDIGSGNEIVDGSGADFRVLGTSGAYAIAVANTPFSNTFVALGTGTGTRDFDLSGTGLTSVRYIRLSVSTGTATIDAIQSLHFFVDTIHPTAGPLADVGFATITMRRQKSPATSLDCLLELIAPDGSFQGKNESGFGDETSQDRSDAALIQMQLTQQGFYRYLGRGYDTQPDEQAFGNFFTRLETAGNYDKAKIQISANSENQTTAQKQGRIDSPRQRDSYLFATAPGKTLSIVVNGVSNPSLADPVVELYDPEDFLIAANDNFPARGKNAALTVTLPTIGRAGGAFPNPSTYRIIVSGIDGESGPPTPVSNGVAHLRKANGGNYELKVFTGALSGGVAPAIAGITPNIATQGATDLTIIINGSNFANGARVTFSESGITTKAVSFVNANQLQAVIDIAATALIGRHNVTVTNPDAQSATATGALEIRRSLGTSVLSWQAPSAGQALAPPANLQVRLGSSLPGKKLAQKIILAGKRKPFSAAPQKRLNLANALASNLITEIEPNNKPEQAQLLSGASPLVLNGRAEVRDAGEIILAFESEDDDLEDLFKVTTTAPGLNIFLDGFASDCDLYLFNSDLSEIIDESINGDENPPEEIDLPELEAGTYFIAVSIYDPAPLGADTTAYVMTLKGQFGGKATLQSYNIFRSTSANAKNTGTRVGSVNANTASFTDPMPHTGNFFYQVTAVYDQGESVPSNEAAVLVTNVEDARSAVVPAGFDLRQNYPNPFPASGRGIFDNPATRIQFELPKPSHVKIEIFNVQGQKIRTLIDKQTPAGLHAVNWDGRMDGGEPAVAGIYLYRLKTQEYEQGRKLLLLR